jgi:hypothetical protein
MSQNNHDKRMNKWRSIASFMLMGVFSANQTESKLASTRGGTIKYLPGGLRGMSQRQRRKRIRQGILSR